MNIENKLNYVFKKLLNKPNTLVNGNYFQEPSLLDNNIINSNVSIFSQNNLYRDTIPTKLPTLLETATTDNNGDVINDASNTIGNIASTADNIKIIVEESVDAVKDGKDIGSVINTIKDETSDNINNIKNDVNSTITDVSNIKSNVEESVNTITNTVDITKNTIEEVKDTVNEVRYSRRNKRY